MNDIVQPLPREALIRLPEVLRYTGLGKSELYARIADGDFPQAVQLGPRAVAWFWGDPENASRPIAQTSAAQHIPHPLHGAPRAGFDGAAVLRMAVKMHPFA